MPFEPVEGRPVYCRDCLNAIRAGNAEVGTSQEERKNFEIRCTHCGKIDYVPFEPFENSIVLCDECMKNPNVKRVGSKIIHRVICSQCGDECEVPFKPDQGSKVLCRNCHKKEQAAREESRRKFEKYHPATIHGSRVRVDIKCDECGASDTLPYLPKATGPILCRRCGELKFGEDWARKHRVAVREFPFICARCGRQDFITFRAKKDTELLCKHCLNDQAVIRHDDREREKIDAFASIRRKVRDAERDDNN